jgi:asparagine synthase (glutamine-hydrolysing)
MVSDVPVGAFLSGGIDSSLVVACMAELSEEPINTFNISFAEQEFDESPFAEEIAQKYNTRHHRILIRPSEFLDSLEDIFAATDSPSGDGANTYLVAKYTREKVKVALSGLGGDELFAGYTKFSMFKKINANAWIHHLPFSLRKWLAGYIMASGDRGRIKLADLMLQKNWDLAAIYPALRKSYRQVEANSLVASKVNDDFVETNLRLIEKNLKPLGDISKCTIGEFETYTRDVLLRDTDQMAMAHALEVRAPFFDYRLIEYMLSLPDKHKFSSRPKQLLVDSLSPRIPASISGRKKMGFTFPIQKWLRSELRELAMQKISFLADRKEFNHTAVNQIWHDFQSGNSKVNWSQVWQLVVLADWIDRNKLQ